jgi:ribonucleoside-diphosphate reductase alpha chain
MNELLSSSNETDLAIQPGILRVIKRDGQLASYDENKIMVAMTKAFLAIEGENAASSNRIREEVHRLTQNITTEFHRRFPAGGTLHIEAIQDKVEAALMRAGEYEVGRAYILYREERRKQRGAEENAQQPDQIYVTLENKQRQLLDKTWLTNMVNEACQNLSAVDHHQIIVETFRNLYDGVPIQEVVKAAIMSARTLIEREPNYTYVTARLLFDSLRDEALSYLNLPKANNAQEMAKLYPQYFSTYIQKGVELKLLDPMMAKYDLQKLGKAIKPECDFQFTYLGLQTLYDRYFLHSNKTRFELPQAFYMRVAMGLASAEKENEREKWAIEFYNVLSAFDFMSSTPTLFNSGTLRPQLSSCYLSTIDPDSIEGICDSLKDNCLLSKYAGGLGNDWSNIRAMGAYINGTNGESLGTIPFLGIYNAALSAVNQGGKRKGAACAYMETFHRDIEEFLDLRKNTGDERRRTHDMNTANWIPDLFMIRVAEDGDWTLFSPDETPDLHHLYGEAFAKAYIKYEQLAALGKIKNFKKIPAKQLWRKMLSMLYETGHPWITFKDVCNLRSPQQHAGIVHSSNLCTEITLNTSADEIAVCNLGSINLAQHLKNGELDKEKLRKTIQIAIRMLDNVIDYNFYPVDKAQNSNLRHRPIGMGLMGFQDVLYQLRIPYASDAAVEFADTSMELISYYAIESSMMLAKERGQYQSFEGSLWSQGILPIDSIAKVREAREIFGTQYLQQDSSIRLDWDKLRKEVMKHGMRNSNVMAIAPTATIANICGVTASIEPTYQNLFVKSNLSGEFTVINPHLVDELKARNLWDEVMVSDLKYFDGSLQKIDRIPQELKQLYATAFEIDPLWLVKAGSRRQKWIDQAQSLNLYIAQASGKKLDELYRQAWLLGLKTTYYLRSLGASHTEKSTITDHVLNAVQVDLPKACSINDPDCESCQ